FLGGSQPTLRRRWLHGRRPRRDREPTHRGVVMKKERKGAIRRRLGPIGLSLVAAAVTAVGVAAVSGGQRDNREPGGQTFNRQVPAAPGGGQGVVQFRAPSAADRQKMEEFQQCMQDNGAPAPPHLDSSGSSDSSSGPPEPPRPPKPPNAADQQKIQKAYEACKDKLPEDLLNMPGPPGIGVGCGPGGPG